MTHGLQMENGIIIKKSWKKRKSKVDKVKRSDQTLRLLIRSTPLDPWEFCAATNGGGSEYGGNDRGGSSRTTAGGEEGGKTTGGGVTAALFPRSKRSRRWYSGQEEATAESTAEADSDR